MSNFIDIKDLQVYQLSKELSGLAWSIYQNLSYEMKKHMGDQFLRSTDSIGANIVEGYHRFHFKDKTKFYYYSRASLAESKIHWLELLKERELVKTGVYDEFKTLAMKLEVKLNNFITVTKRQIK